jgi:hypothetical protein
MVLNRQPFRATYKAVMGEWEFQGCDASDFEAIFVPDKKTIPQRPLMTLKRGAPIITNPVASHTQTVFNAIHHVDLFCFAVSTEKIKALRPSEVEFLCQKTNIGSEKYLFYFIPSPWFLFERFGPKPE